ncbi:hypothetical protein N9F72_03745 [Gammaproteobacteria bacterium]|nr:hypothetical protein [Gammaproteobacteria bacterium]
MDTIMLGGFGNWFEIWILVSNILLVIFTLVALRVGLSFSKWVLKPVERLEEDQHIVIHWFIRLIRYAITLIIISFCMIVLITILAIFVYILGFGYMFSGFFQLLIDSMASPRI